MKETNQTIIENEKTANILSAKVMLITFFLFTLAYILDLINIFTVDKKIMTIAYIMASILLLLPTLLVRILKYNSLSIKYIIVCSAVFFVVLTSTTLTFHAVLLNIFGIAIASLYFSRELNIIATILTVVGTSAAQIIAFFIKTCVDDNFPTLKSVIVYNLVPQAIILAAISCIFLMLSKRTVSLLKNMMGADEQKKILNSMQLMKSKSIEVSSSLLSFVSQLEDISTKTSDSNKQIAKESGFVMEGSNENMNHIGNINEKANNIINMIVDLNKMSNEISSLAEQVKTLTEENQSCVNIASNTMNEISSSTDECKKTIDTLRKESAEVINIINVISNISSQTNILSLNASIEAARAGEHGKGFAIVATEIQSLSEQTEAAVKHIKEIISKVVQDTEFAVSAMEQSSNLTNSGMENLMTAQNSASSITSSNVAMSQQMNHMNNTVSTVTKNIKEIASNISAVNDTISNNFASIKQVTNATESNSKSADTLLKMVGQIKESAKELNDIIK